MVDLERDESVGQRSVFPYLTALVNCVLWCFYGFSREGSLLIFLINLFGAALEFYYVCKFLHYCDEDERLWGFVYPVVGFVVLVGILIIFLSDQDKYMLFFSWVCALCSSLVSVSPLFNLGTVYQQMSMDSMPPLLQVVLALGNSMLWAGYACTAKKFNNFIFYPSLVSFVCALIQLLLHIILRRQGDPELDEPLQ